MAVEIKLAFFGLVPVPHGDYVDGVQAHGLQGQHFFRPAIEGQPVIEEGAGVLEEWFSVDPVLRIRVSDAHLIVQ